jgi:hypothetical protein
MVTLTSSPVEVHDCDEALQLAPGLDGQMTVLLESKSGSADGAAEVRRKY